MDDNAFLHAIGAAPDDAMVRLVYADWLEEQEDFRAELVRLQVHLREMDADDPAFIPTKARETELRAQCPPIWLAKLDPPVWCAVGNIVDSLRGQAGEPQRRGTRLFRPNAKIILATSSNCYAVLDPPQFDHERVEVIGQHRKSRDWICSWVSIAATTNWRVQLVHTPQAIVCLRKTGWPGFAIQAHEFECPPQRNSAEALEALFAAAIPGWRR